MEAIEKPSWSKLSEKEFKDIIAELAKKMQPAQIGLVLRDQYGVPTAKVYGKRLSEILKELGLESTVELQNIQKKADKLKEHLEKNHGDKKAKHRLQKASGRVNKLKKYFSQNQ